MTIIALNNQSLLDISIQYTGMVDNCFDIAIANGISVSDILTAGMTLEIPEDLPTNTDVLNYYTAKKIQPATGLTDDELKEIPELKGIGYMKVGGNFKVS